MAAWNGRMVGTQDSRVLTHVGTRPSRVQAGNVNRRPGRRRPTAPVARNLGTWPSCTTRPRNTSRRFSPSKRRASSRCGPASWSASGSRRRRCRRRSAASSTAAGSSSTATAGCSLTTKGRGLATTIVRRHRLAERLLVDVIGLEWEKVHARGRPLGARDLGRRRGEARVAPRRSRHLPARQPDPGLAARRVGRRRSRSPTPRSVPSPSRASANGLRCRTKRSC